MAPSVYHCVHFSAPASAFSSLLSCRIGPKVQCKNHISCGFFVTFSPSFVVESFRPQSTDTSNLLGSILSYVDGDCKQAEKNRFGHQNSTKNNESLVRRIQHETRSRRITDRDSTPVVRALTWALRGVKDEETVGVIVGNLEFQMSIFTSVIQKLGMEKKPQAAVALLRWLQRREGGDGTIDRPNVFTYNSLLGVLKANHCYEMATMILEEMRENGISSDIVTCNTVISMYEQQGRPDEALKVYEDLRTTGMVPDLFTYRTMIQALARSGKCERVLELYRDLVHQERSGSENGRPKLKREKEQRQELAVFVVQLCYRRIWSWLSSDTSTIKELGQLFAGMRQAEIRLDEKMCRNLIRACGQRVIDYYPAKWLYFNMREQGFYLNVSLCNHIIRLLGKAKRWWAALGVYEHMMSVGPPPEETTHRLLLSHFQILLNSAGKRGIWKWALQLLDKMQEKGIKPDSFAWNAALIACGRAHKPAAAIEVFQRMTAAGQQPGVLSYGALLSALEKGNLTSQAEQVWKHMLKVGTKPNEYAYTTMITVRGKSGNYSEAADLFYDMQRNGMEPTVVTHNAMITACARASDGQGAVKWLQQMEASSVEPDSITYSQVIILPSLHFREG
uniref:Pentacotripeptide-repeat region of PRORP domain-containing protein n=1 Tax=Physcomitrium patens TaxID=3218 RepID=A0A7I4D228_PHYPA